MKPLIGIVLLLLVVVTLVTIMSLRDRQNKERIAEVVRQVGGEPLAVGTERGPPWSAATAVQLERGWGRPKGLHREDARLPCVGQLQAGRREGQGLGRIVLQTRLGQGLAARQARPRFGVAGCAEQPADRGGQLPGCPRWDVLGVGEPGPRAMRFATQGDTCCLF